jgi:hypothetical protein
MATTDTSGGASRNVRAVLIGVSDYADGSAFDNIPNARNSLTRMSKVLTDPGLCGWPEDRIEILENPRDGGELSWKIRSAALLAEDAFLLYYVGHGMVAAGDDLFLTLPGTRRELLEPTSLPWRYVVDSVRDCRAPIKINILDCCYAGRATGTLAGASPELLADATKIDGFYTLAATTRNQLAHAGPPDGCTTFTAELCSLIEAGIPDGPEYLTFDHIYPPLRERLIASNRPEPTQRGTNTVTHYPFTRNKAYPASPPPTPSDADAWLDRLANNPEPETDFSDLLRDPAVAGEVAARLYGTGGERERGIASGIDDTANRTFASAADFAGYWNRLDGLLPRDEPADELRYRWTAHARIDWVPHRITAIRVDNNRAGNSLLREFTSAIENIQDLVRLCAQFNFNDAVSMLEYGIERERRKPADIAILAEQLWHRQQGGSLPSPADKVQAIIATGAPVGQVAVIVKACGTRELSQAILEEFVQRRTNSEKATLLIVLRRGADGTEDTAAGREWSAEFLQLCLRDLREDYVPGPGGVRPGESQNFLEMLHHRAPAERILEEWADAQLGISHRRGAAIALIVKVIITYYQHDRRWLYSFLEHIGKNFKPEDLVAVCTALHGRKPHGSDAVRKIRQSIPGRDMAGGLPVAVLEWRKSKMLRGTLDELLADIVAGEGMRHPPTAAQIDELDQRLSKSKWPDIWNPNGAYCARRLRIADARHVARLPASDSPGEHIAQRLSKVSGLRDRDWVARDIAESLTGQLHAGDIGDQERFEQYLLSLCRAHETEAVYLACRQLGKLPGNGPVNAQAVLGVGLKLCKEGYQRYGKDILERLLDNSQDLTPAEVVNMIEVLKNCDEATIPPVERDELLQKTIGQWFDISCRTQVARELHRRTFYSEEATITQPPW